MRMKTTTNWTTSASKQIQALDFRRRHEIDITVRPISPEEIDRVPLRCWPDREAIRKLFTRQETIGMAAWDGERCVAQLHCYRVTAPNGKEWKAAEHGPMGGSMGANWWTESDRAFQSEKLYLINIKHPKKYLIIDNLNYI